MFPFFSLFASFCLLVWLTTKFSARSGHYSDALEERINAMLPQTQCGQCNFQGCLPYARAIVENRAAINRCPPGGQDTVRQIASLIGVDEVPLSTQLSSPEVKLVARIDEDSCIGCVKCIRACPVDAIVGAAKQMHSVLEKDCTGCELCLSPCPVDCISMQAAHLDVKQWVWTKPANDYRLHA
ncbi:MAG: electron transport complex subunit RsxB [Gammaproteobacteria bacterium]|nr:electron transport complex subunit RsxB [Gammaproteobacteria bacterium]